ncbi:MAG TPA: sulfatase/phosphatase domain-containing protein, partial [Isosphaeraceae bacterium]|nr:sulfatase/phosphatase domain-containing protein [Isosphaeraceae bacterium]
HRAYEPGSGLRAGRDPSEVTLPAYYPDNRTVRSDYLDYALEVEWFDSHLVRSLKKLEEIGELDNTIVVVTSDHGEPFPRVKGQIYEKGFHIPLAIRWGNKVKPGRVIDDFINVRDYAPTFLEAAGIEPPPSMTGKSFLDVLTSDKSGQVDPSRNRMVVGKERHDIGRPNDEGFPVRALRTPDYLYIRNFEPSRWPVGNPETGYRNCDDGPTKELILSRFDKFYELCFGKRPSEELYRIDQDSDCLTNLADDPKYADIKNQLYQEMNELLRKDQDPRILGQGAIFDTYRYMGNRSHSYEEWMKHNGTGVAR